MWATVGVATLLMGSLGAALTLGLYAVTKWQKGDSDDDIELLTQLLPGNNCGACGMAGCSAMARALKTGEALPHACPVATPEQIDRLSEYLGVEGGPREKKVARVFCGGTEAVAPQRAIYEGVLDCRAADLVGKGSKSCPYGCLGLGTCARVCPFGAVTLGPDGLPVVDERLCTGCGLCAAACPRGVIQLVDPKQQVYVRCVSWAAGKEVRAQCQVGCIACAICSRVCEQGRIDMVGNLARIDPDACTRCGACALKCPTGAIINLAQMAAAQSLNGETTHLNSSVSEVAG